MKISYIELVVFELYDYFYKQGEYGSHGVAKVCLFLRKFFNYYNFDVINRDNYVKMCPQIFEKYAEDTVSLNIKEELFPYEIVNKLLSFKRTKSLYKKISEVIDKLAYKYLSKTDAQPTDKFSTKVMQAFANKISREKQFIDPCVGTGLLLENLKSNFILGYDVDPYCVEIARTRLFFSSNGKFVVLNINQRDGLSYFSGLNDIETFIFDPPLNVPFEVDSIAYRAQFINNYCNMQKTVPSEYAFLSTILNDTNKPLDYICIFSSSLLTSEDKLKKTFKKFLLDNSLKAIVSSPEDNSGINKIILVGQQKSIVKNDYIYLITPKTKNLTDVQINDIVEICTSNRFEEKYNEKEYFDIAKILKVSKEEIINNNYLINLPRYEKDEKFVEIETLERISDKIKNINAELMEKSKKFEKFLNNLKEGIPNIEIKNKSEEKADTNFKIWFDAEYSDLNNAIGIFADNKELDWTPIDFVNNNHIDLEALDSCIYNLRLLFKAKRLRCKNGKLEIYSKKELPEYKSSESLSSYIIESNNKNPYYQKITKNLSSRQIDYFNTYIKYYFDFDDENKNETENNKLISSFKEFSISEEHVNIATLKALGLLYDNPVIEEGIERYIPYVAILNPKEVI